ncbi:hypothetical protein KPATCC21470_1061 [Kitasatospora purpeofusca]
MADGSSGFPTGPQSGPGPYAAASRSRHTLHRPGRCARDRALAALTPSPPTPCPPNHA